LAALLLACTVCVALDPAALRPLNHWLYDQRLRLLAPQQGDPRIVIVDIDERALAASGRWPWPRAQLAELLDRLFDQQGARLVGLDLVLAEPDRGSGLAALDTLMQGTLRDDAGLQAALQRLRPQLDNDGRLAASLRRHAVVLGFHLSNEPGTALIGQLPAPLLPVAMLGPLGAPLLRWSGHGGNLPQLQDAAQQGAGFLNAIIDDDGVVRRMPLLVQYQGGIQPALALAMARALLVGDAAPGSGNAGVALRLAPATPPLRSVQLRGPAGSLQAPVDAQGVALVPYLAPDIGFARYSAADVLTGRLPPDALRGKLVLLGVSAPGLIDQRNTPVDAALLGTVVHAHLLSGLLQGRLLAVPAEAPWIEAAALLMAGGLLMAALPRQNPWPALGLTVTVMAVWLLGHALAWHFAGLALPMAGGLLVPPLLLLVSLGLGYQRATGARRQLTRLFGQYVPPELVQEMSLAPERYTMQSRSAELTVLFGDVADFSHHAEHMPPAALGAMMNLVFSHLTDVVRAHRGTLDKYIGDAVMAFWGAPLDDPAHARHAVDAALAMQQRLPAIHAELARHGWPPLTLNIGINTGTVVVGDMGSRHRRAYTVMGDAVNLAARLQSLSSQHRLGLVVGEATHAALGTRLCLAMGRQPVRGREGLASIWQPLPWHVGELPQADAWVQDWQRMHMAAAAGRMADALALLAALDRQAMQAELAPLLPLCRWRRAQWPP